MKSLTKLALSAAFAASVLGGQAQAADTREVLSSLPGYDDAKLDGLKSQGII